MANKNLGAARKAKQDEFYTQWDDIEREMNAYLEYDPDVFRGKTVLLPCDDPEWSNFAKFFALNFEEYGLKKLIATSYAPASNPAIDEYKPTLFELEAPQYDETKSRERGRLFVLDGTDVNHDGKVNIDDLQWTYLGGDGDFRSDEVTALRDEADIVVTNPPFSLFREFVAWLFEGRVKFTIIGSANSITYRDVFAHIQNNEMWMGVTRNGGGQMWFRVPENYPIKSGQKTVEGVRYQTVGSSCWFTNLDHGRRHDPLPLLTMEENIKFSRWKEVKGIGYHRFVNFDAIDVPRIDAIPKDYEGIMAVPMTFLGKYVPEQFEIVANMDDHSQLKAIGVQPLTDEFIAGYRAVGGTGAQRAGGYWMGLPDPNRFPFKRILIRHRNPATPEA